MYLSFHTIPGYSIRFVAEHLEVQRWGDGTVCCNDAGMAPDLLEQRTNHMQRQEGLTGLHHCRGGPPCARHLPRTCRGPQHDELVERSRLSGGCDPSGIRVSAVKC